MDSRQCVPFLDQVDMRRNADNTSGLQHHPVRVTKYQHCNRHTSTQIIKEANKTINQSIAQNSIMLHLIFGNYSQISPTSSVQLKSVQSDGKTSKQPLCFLAIITTFEQYTVHEP